MTDASNASRTLLFDIAAGQWSAELCGLFGVPPHALPEVTASTGVIGHTDPDGVPRALAADRGSGWRPAGGAVRPGMLHTRRVEVHLRDRIVRAGEHRLVDRQSPAGHAVHGRVDGDGGKLTYALEGSVFVTGAAIQWLRDGLGLLDAAPDSEQLARSVADSGGVVFVPALTGLGAPDWDPDARGAIFGITQGHDERAPGPRDPRGDRVRGARRGGRDGGRDGGTLATGCCGWTAGRAPTTC